MDMQRWSNLQGSSSVITLQKRGIAQRISDFSGPVTSAGVFGVLGDGVGVRLRGMVTPPLTGNYSFYVAGDDNVRLWLSSDSSRFNKQMIAWSHSWTGREQWEKFPTQKSKDVFLTAGQSYYLEAMMQELSGAESLGIGWSFTPENIALGSLGAVASQSSTYGTGYASRAIDGNLNSDMAGGSVTLTNSEQNSWWQVDFGQNRLINQVVLHNRNAYQNRVSNFRISALNESGVELYGEDFFKDSGNVVESFVWNLPATVDARRVKIQILGYNRAGNGYLNLAEVQAFNRVRLPENFALASKGSTASQSTTYSTATADRAIDGNVAGDMNLGSVSLTNNGTNSFLEVNFNQERLINRLVVHNRDSYQTRLSNFRLSAIGLNGNELVGANFFTSSGNAGDSFLWNLPSSVDAKKVRIQLLGKNRDNNGYLNLSEIQAYQSSSQSDTNNIQIIPSCYLSSLPPEPLDLDDDNLPDSFENSFGLSTASSLGQHGEYGDFDNDGISNFEEYQLGSNPTEKDALADGLTRERWFEVSGSDVANLTSNRSRFLREPNERIHVASVKEGVEGDNLGTRYRGSITAPVTGEYTFWISGDDEAELWLADGSVSKNIGGTITSLTNRFGKVRLAQIKDQRFGTDYTEVSDFDRLASQRSRPISLNAGQSYYFEVLHKEGSGSAHVSVAWQVPGGGRALIPETFFTSNIPEEDDTDDDYLPASWENQNGLNPNDNGLADARDGQYGDWDADGLTNLEEYQLGTNPKSADTDSDTMSDKDERDYFHSDPLVSNLLNTVLHHTVNISSYSSTSVPWEVRQDGSILAHERRGWTEYQFVVNPGEEGVYEVRITGGAEGGSVRSVENLPLSFHLNGEMLSRQTMRCLLGQNSTLKQMTPWLGAGIHKFRVQNHNTRADCKLRLNSIVVHRLGGADADSNGVPDWVEQRLAAENTMIRIPVESRTSPACLEGLTTSFESLRMTKTDTDNNGQPFTQPLEVSESVNQGFYSDIHLDSEADTSVSISFQNGAKVINHSITWTPTNILAESAIALRKGDSVKLTAHEIGASAAGTFTLTHNGQNIAAPDGTLNHQADQPFVIAFDTPGQHVLTATWTSTDGIPQTGTLNVTTETADFGPEFAVQTYNRRTWTISGVNGMDIETNDDIAWNETTVTGSSSRSFLVGMYESGTSYIVARLPSTGEIIARGTLNAFTIAKVGETSDSQLVLIRPDGSRVYRFTVVAENLPANAEVRLRTHFQGAIFSNGSRDLVLRSSDFSSNGTADILIEWGDATPHRICHTMRTYLVD